jgi:hypothetical protein
MIGDCRSSALDGEEQQDRDHHHRADGARRRRSFRRDAERADRAIEAHRGKDLLDRRLGEPADEIADGEQDQRAEHVWNGIENGAQHLRRRAGDRLDAQRVEGRDGHRDHDQEEDDHADRAAQRRLSGARAGGDRSSGSRRRGRGAVADAGSLQPAVRVGGHQRTLQQAADDLGDDEPDEEDQAGGDQIGDEGEGVGGELPDRLQHLRQLQRLQRQHDADQEDEPEGDVADQAADGFAGSAS